MGRGGNSNNRKQQQQQQKQETLKKKLKDQSSEEPEQQQQEQVDGEDDEEIIDDEIDYFDEAISDEDEEVLGKIDQEILAAEEAYKLSWAAIHNLKKKEKEIHQQMDKEMRAIQAKYEDLKAPIVDKIAKVASGHPVEKQLYTEHQYTRTLNVNKYKPKAIEGYWVSVLESMGFIDCEEDRKILENCVSLSCARLDRKRQKPGQENIQNDDEKEYENQELISAVLKFKDNEIIKNKQLKISICKKGEDDYEKKEVTAIKFKIQNPPEQSLLAVMFDPETDGIQLYQYAQDLYRAYSNSVFFYFYETKGNELEGADEEGEGEDEDEDEQVEDQNEDDDDDDEDNIQPIKKSKKEPNAGLQKPECKQQ